MASVESPSSQMISCVSSRHESSQRRREVHLWSADTRDHEEGSRIESQRTDNPAGKCWVLPAWRWAGRRDLRVHLAGTVFFQIRSHVVWGDCSIAKKPGVVGCACNPSPWKGRGGRQKQIPKGCSLSSTCMSVLSHTQACTLPRISYRHTSLTHVHTKVIKRKPFCHSNSCLELGAIPLQVQLEAWSSIGATERQGDGCWRGHQQSSFCPLSKVTSTDGSPLGATWFLGIVRH